MFVDRPVGIDLGTTNSEIALLDPSERDLVVYEDRFGRRTVPSAVAWDPKKEALLVGRAARNRRGRDPGPIESIKRKMGQRATVRLGDEDRTPEAISAEILAYLREVMQRHLAERAPDTEVRVDRAVITVPAYFDAPQVEATRRAGELAGLEVLGVLQEPTAAAIYHTWKRQLGDGVFLVYDLGGGTFDVSILRCLAGEYQVLAIDGDNYLGGDDLDRRYAEHLRQELAGRGYALDLDLQEDDGDRERFQRLVHLAQEIKEQLSTAEVIHVNKTGVLEDQAGETVDYEGEVGRADYEAVVKDLVATTLACCERALAQSEARAKVGLADIDHVVLVGGSTRVPLVVRQVTERLCARSKAETPLQDEVDTCVALGAAVHAAQLGGLRVGDDAMQVLVRTPLVGRRAELKMTLDVEVAPEPASSLRVEGDDGVLAEASFEEVPAEKLSLRVPLGDAPENPVRLVLADAEEQELHRLPLALYRGDVRPRASALSRPSVIAKDIAVEVTRGGRRDRKVLLPTGTGLPAEAEHTFYTADRSGAVVLRLLQNRLPIKTLMFTVDPELPVGTPVALALRCDEAMRLEARAEVAGQELWATVEPAKAETPTAQAIDALLARADEVARNAWGREASYLRRELDPLTAGIREVLRTDPDKLAALTLQLEQLLEEFAGRPEDGLSPPLHRFEATLDSLMRMVYREQGTLLGMDTGSWEERIEALNTKGRAAWEAQDAGAWRRAYNEAKALQETAGEEEFSKQKINDPGYLTLRLVGITSFAKRLEESLVDFVPSSAAEVQRLQVEERDRLLRALRDKAQAPLGELRVDEEGDLSALRRRLEVIRAELDRIDAAFERLPSLGLVSERG
jgi:molecular chaperone DnaK